MPNRSPAPIYANVIFAENPFPTATNQIYMMNLLIDTERSSTLEKRFHENESLCLSCECHFLVSFLIKLVFLIS